jgi:hypothetical protein
MDDRLAAVTHVIFLLDHRGAVGGLALALLDHGGAITVSVAITVMALADSRANANGSHANTDTVG